MITAKTLNKIKYDFTLNYSLNLLFINSMLSDLCMFRIEVKDIILFIIITQNCYYYYQYKSMFLKLMDYTVIEAAL